MLNSIIKFFLENKLVTVLVLLLIVAWGIVTAPFNWETSFLPRDPVPVDAIPDISENQQIVFTEWMGRSPQDVEDQITYPLTTALLGLPGVKSVRSSSAFGFSSIYIIFNEDIEFYWSRSRVLENPIREPRSTETTSPSCRRGNRTPSARSPRAKHSNTSPARSRICRPSSARPWSCASTMT